MGDCDYSLAKKDGIGDHAVAQKMFARELVSIYEVKIPVIMASTVNVLPAMITH